MRKPIALLTGAGTGLGKELALRFSHTHTVILIGRRENLLNELAADINTYGRALAVPCDITEPDEIEQLMVKLGRESLLPVDLVVHNAGIGRFGSVADTSSSDLELMFKTNVFAPIALTKNLLPSMKKQNNGTFLFILSTAALRGKSNESGYAASKFALRGFAESLDKETEPFGIRVVRAYMGGMNTPFWDHGDHVKDPSRFWKPSEVAHLIMEQIHEKDEIVIESKKQQAKGGSS
ncbi:SDR family NAD(P)-dependent oxidoreductase [Jeotgalibacillus sp. ET6]|uniref:SDR family NAD(P)-dependent oxidoreductase n=1 Tax=Jeotgalibacillus sp. ET6 TaxID=3037260 RepID=UPI00241880BB|nr:SDR family oxidoreductase [Jeotgalibacillus sp. ET6]MDG5473333.1 SDR family NAD(P)-dependent oxidoreductase [Jeotgalibacillus sp. ET6]